MYITYSNDTGEALSTYDTVATVDFSNRCIMFRDHETAMAAWIADATAKQAINAFGGREVDPLIPAAFGRPW